MRRLADGERDHRMAGGLPPRRLGEDVHGVERFDFAAFRYGKQDRFSLALLKDGPTIAALIRSSQSRECGDGAKFPV
jgi:hypothetical protein